ncbi:MAG: hypothetical protein LBT20_04675 [Clostridiales bacterium]|jgi:hypothetical protein|nr:hypothetical protein [Clostridiales bacterium]
MAKIIDFISLRLVCFVLLFILWYSVIGKFVAAILLSLLFVVAGSLIYTKLIAHRIKKESLNAESMNMFFILRGNAYVAEYLASVIDPVYAPTQTDDGLLLDTSGESRAIIFPLFKFSKLGRDEFVKLYRIAQKHETKKIYVISKSLDREILLLAHEFGAQLIHVKIPVFYRYLKHRAALPPAEPKTRPKRRSAEEWKVLAESIFTRRHSRRFLFAAALLLIMSMITPLKNYYYVMSAIAGILAALCLFLPNRIASTKNGIFDVKRKKKHGDSE